MDELIEELKYKGVLKSKNIEQALRKADRSFFVPENLKYLAYRDTALPIGYEQTISQPYTVVFMLELLKVREGMNVLEVGFGSAWQSALLADLVGKTGAVYSMEIIPELCDFGKVNISTFSDLNKRVEFYCQNANRGLPEVSESINGFDRIIDAAAIKQVPEYWRKQLKIGGILVYPKGTSIHKEIKLDENTFDNEYFEGFVFVPFVDDDLNNLD